MRRLNVLACALAVVLATPAVAWAEEMPQVEAAQDELQVVWEADDADAVVEAEGAQVETDPVAVSADEDGVEPCVVGEATPVVAEPVQDDAGDSSGGDAPASSADEAEAAGEPQVQATDEPSEAVPSEETAAELGQAADDAAPSEAPVADGIYVIETGVSKDLVLDVAGGATKNGTNVQTYTYNGTNAQKWRLTYDAAQGGYTISLANSAGKKVLDLDTSAQGKHNVRIWDVTGALSQLWDLVADGKKWSLVSRAAGGLALDVAGASTAKGANVQAYRPNGTAAQRFFLLPLDSPVPAGDTIDEGVYTVSPKAASSQALDIAGASWGTGANLQLYKGNGTAAQKLQFTSDGEGYYTVTSLVSGKVLDVAGGSPIPGTNVRQWKSNGTDAQKWAARKNDDGSVTLINKATWLVLDVSGGSYANAANIQGWRDNGTVAQRFVLSPKEYLDNGIFEVRPVANDALALDVTSGSAKDGAAVQLWRDNNSLAQRFQAYRVGKNKYQLRTAASGGWLAETADAKIVQLGSSATQDTADVWEAFWNGAFFSLRNTRTGNVLTVDGSIAKGTTLAAASAGKRSSQHFGYAATGLVDNGWYQLKSSSGKMLETVAGAGNGANVRVWASNGTWAQYFYLTRNGQLYTLRDAVSDKYVRATGSGNGANVQLGAAQNWKLQIADGGGINVVNAASGKVLDVSGGSTANGANVQLWRANGTAAQRWVLLKAAPTSGNAELDGILDTIVKRVTGTGAGALRASYNYVSNFSYVTMNEWPAGSWVSWSKPYAIYMYRHGYGNCYRYASLQAWIARRLGYDAKVIAGRVLTNAGWEAHGWVEVNLDGSAYLLDPDMYHGNRTRDFFMRTYAKPPMHYAK